MKHPDSSQKSSESKLNKFFGNIRSENYDHTFSDTGNWLKANTKIISIKNSERKLTIMKKYFSTHKLKLAYSFLILAFLVAACNYPVTQEETIGDVISWTVDKENKEAIAKIENLDWVKNGQYNFNEKSTNERSVMEYSVVLSNTDMNNIKEYQKQLESIPGIITVNITPLNEPVTRPVYSAALNNIFKIDINATNMSDKELEKEITAQLKKAGIEPTTVNFEKTSTGNRIVKIKFNEEGMKKDGGFDVTIKDGNKVERLKEVRKTSGNTDRFKGKSDKEIKQMVIEDFKDGNLSDDQIEIVRDGDKVMIKIKKEAVSGKDKLETEDVEK